MSNSFFTYRETKRKKKETKRPSVYTMQTDAELEDLYDVVILHNEAEEEIALNLKNTIRTIQIEGNEPLKVKILEELSYCGMPETLTLDHIMRTTVVMFFCSKEFSSDRMKTFAWHASLNDRITHLEPERRGTVIPLYLNDTELDKLAPLMKALCPIKISSNGELSESNKNKFRKLFRKKLGQLPSSTSISSLSLEEDRTEEGIQISESTCTAVTKEEKDDAHEEMDCHPTRNISSQDVHTAEEKTATIRLLKTPVQVWEEETAPISLWNTNLQETGEEKTATIRLLKTPVQVWEEETAPISLWNTNLQETGVSGSDLFAYKYTEENKSTWQETSTDSCAAGTFYPKIDKRDEFSKLSNEKNKGNVPLPIFSEKWQDGATFDSSGGILCTSSSDVKLIVPPGAVNKELYKNVYMAVSTDLVRFSQLLKINDYVASPIAEFWSENKTELIKPVQIILPNCLTNPKDLERVKILRIFSDEYGKVTIQELLKKNEDGEPEHGVFEFNNGQLCIYASCFSAFVCVTCGQENTTPDVYVVGCASAEKGSLEGYYEGTISVAVWDKRLVLREFLPKNATSVGHPLSLPVERDQKDPHLKMKLNIGVQKGLTHWKIVPSTDGTPLHEKEQFLRLRGKVFCFGEKCSSTASVCPDESVAWQIYTATESARTIGFRCTVEIYYMPEKASAMIEPIGKLTMNVPPPKSNGTATHINVQQGWKKWLCTDCNLTIFLFLITIFLVGMFLFLWYTNMFPHVTNSTSREL